MLPSGDGAVSWIIWVGAVESGGVLDVKEEAGEPVSGMMEKVDQSSEVTTAWLQRRGHS